MGYSVSRLLKGRGRTVVVCMVSLLLCVLGFVCRTRLLRLVQDASLYLRYAFIQRALVVGVLAALCAALLGVVLVLKNYSMIGDGLSHVGFAALTTAVSMGTLADGFRTGEYPGVLRGPVASLFGMAGNSPMVFTLIVVLACAVLLLRQGDARRQRGDAGVALLSTSALAIGVIVSSCTKGMNIDVTGYMFGSILAMSRQDVWISAVLSVLVLLCFVLLYNRIFAITFDEQFAAATGIRTKRYNLLVAVMTAMTIVVGMRLMGTMLISSLIIFPALTVMQVFSGFQVVLISAACVSVVAFVVGLLVSCVIDLPVGAAIVIANLAVYCVFAVIAMVKNK